MWLRRTIGIRYMANTLHLPFQKEDEMHVIDGRNDFRVRIMKLSVLPAFSYFGAFLGSIDCRLRI